jgi:hypothetical protein
MAREITLAQQDGERDGRIDPLSNDHHLATPGIAMRMAAPTSAAVAAQVGRAGLMWPPSEHSDEALKQSVPIPTVPGRAHGRPCRFGRLMSLLGRVRLPCKRPSAPLCWSWSALGWRHPQLPSRFASPAENGKHTLRDASGQCLGLCCL